MSVNGLSGLVVLEVADTLGAAFAASLLADYNATVIVCEPPEGSALRRLGPAALDKIRWQILARNKESIAVDWADPASFNLIRLLLRRADMLVVDIAKPRQAGNPWFAVLAVVVAFFGVWTATDLFRRVYANVDSVPRVSNGLGVSIISTPKGVMADHSARELRVGGEVLCTVF